MHRDKPVTRAGRAAQNETVARPSKRDSMSRSTVTLCHDADAGVTRGTRPKGRVSPCPFAGVTVDVTARHGHAASHGSFRPNVSRADRGATHFQREIRTIAKLPNVAGRWTR